MRHLRVPLLCGTLVFSTSCYTVNLAPISAVPAEPLPVSARIEIPAQSAQFTYDVHSAAAGAANRFRILVGEALVQYADAYLLPVFPDGDEVSIRITIEGFDVHDFEAHIDARFSIAQEEETLLFDKKYHASGIGHFAQTALGGVFAMKSSMRKTTDEALRSLFEQFLADVTVQYGGWVSEDLDVSIEPVHEPDPVAQPDNQ